MWIARRAGLVSCAHLFSMVAVFAQVAPSSTERAGRDATLSARLAEVAKQHGLPGIAAARVDGVELTALGCAGTRAADAADSAILPGDLWHLGSCTKALTATLVGRMVDRGQVTFDTTLGEGFPDLGDKIHVQLRNVTIRQLLAHRGGITGDASKVSDWVESFATIRSPRAARRKMAEGLLSRAPEKAPGTAFLYSNFGYVLVGALLEAKRDISFEALLVEEVGKPLGMTTLGFGPPGSVDPLTQPRGHVGGADGRLTSLPPGVRADNPRALAPAGTAHASLEDWARFVSAHLRPRPEGFLQPATLATLHTALPGQDYAMGWVLAKRPWAGGLALTHTGSNTHWLAVVWAAPERDFAVLAATNCAIPRASQALDETVAFLISNPAFSGAR